jgi:peroxiredoxin
LVLKSDTWKRTRTAFLSAAGFWLIGALALAGLLWYSNEHVDRTLEVDQLAPPFALTDQDGRAHRLEDYRGRAVALAFLPDAGPDTVAELRSINSVMRQFDTLGVKVFGIAPIDASTAKQLHTAERLEFPLLTDPGGRVAKRYGAGTRLDAENRLSYVIGREGQILLPIAMVLAAQHGPQLVELTECCLDTTPPPPSKLIGKPIADFRLPRVADGQPESLYGDRKQKATVLLIQSAECPCSLKYDARNVELARQYGPRGVRFVALNASHGETPARIAAQAKQAGYPYPVLKDAGNVIADRIEAQVTPEVFVMDRQGILRYHGRIDDSRNPAEVTSHDLRNALDFLLAGKKPPRADASAFGCAIARAPKS